MRAALLCLVLLAPGAAAGQDLFELEVFEYETIEPGGYDVELHTNVMSRGGVAPGTAAGGHHPLHLSVEVGRGWTERLETAVFAQTAPFGRSGSERFAGGHLRAKARLGGISALSLRFGASAEYTFNRAAFDGELQTFELRTIVDYARGRVSLVANPSVEMITHGGDEGLEPVFDLSARAAWAATGRLTLAAEYFSAAGTTRHLQPETAAHHLLFGGLEIGVGSGWALGVSAGHCVTSSEPWVMKSMLGYAF